MAGQWQGQDWEPVVIRKKGPAPGSSAKDPKSLAAAIRSGAQVETVQKFGAGTNKRGGGPSNAQKLENDTENLSHERVSSELKKMIQQARLAKKMTQAQLGNAINEPPKTVQEYENGKAIPNNQVLGKIERALGVKLRGKKK